MGIEVCGAIVPNMPGCTQVQEVGKRRERCGISNLECGMKNSETRQKSQDGSVNENVVLLVQSANPLCNGEENSLGKDTKTGMSPVTS